MASDFWTTAKMRNRRMLMMMAGLAPTPYEKALQRMERRAVRANRVGLEELRLIDIITRRERGEDGTKPMPFAKPDAPQE